MSDYTTTVTVGYKDIWMDECTREDLIDNIKSLESLVRTKDKESEKSEFIMFIFGLILGLITGFTFGIKI